MSVVSAALWVLCEENVMISAVGLAIHKAKQIKQGPANSISNSIQIFTVIVAWLVSVGLALNEFSKWSCITDSIGDCRLYDWLSINVPLVTCITAIVTMVIAYGFATKTVMGRQQERALRHRKHDKRAARQADTNGNTKSGLFQVSKLSCLIDISNYTHNL